MRNIYRETFEQVRAPEDLWREIREIPAREQRPVRRRRVSRGTYRRHHDYARLT